MKNMLKLWLTLLVLTSVLVAEAQNITVKGKVTDNEGLEVIGASIMIKGKPGVGTISDMNGEYALKADSKSVLVFSYIGMKTQEIPVKGKKRIDVTLLPDNNILDEVVVVGYGTTTRKDLTGSVVSIKGDELMQTSTSDVATALAGRVAGVNVTQADGEPGSSISIRVRGGISITQSNEPLYIIDGFPSEDGMANLDPADIESIDILKDASSTAIYGARGANGVVVITTKQGAEGGSRLSVSFDSYIGVRKITKKLPVLSVKEFVLLDYERSINGGQGDVESFQNRYGSFFEIDDNYDDREGIDWQDEALGRWTTTQNYRVRISGGGQELKYNLSYGYFRDLGAMIQSGSSKHNVAFSITHRPSSGRFQANAKLNYAESKVWGMGTSEGNTRFNKMEHIIQYRPIIGLYGDDNTLMWGADPLLEDDYGNPMQSPLLSASEEKKDKLTRTLQINGGFTFKFNKHFSFTNTTGMRYQNVRQDIFNGENSSSGRRSSINGYIQYNEGGTFQTSNVLNYNYKKGKHKLGVMAGQEYVTSWTKNVRSTATNFPNNDIGLNDMNLGTPSSITSEVNYDNKLVSFFGRVNYNFGEKYLVTATVRADGSSKFSAKNKWGIFPSVSAAWRIGEEDFIKRLGVFSDLKLRAGYGLAGNNRIASYASLDLLESVRYPNGSTVSSGYVPSGIPSEYLKWEANATFNLGVDFGFLGQRITFSPEFYINKSSNLLLNSRVPLSAGFDTMLRNIGKTRNVGIDVTLNTVNIQKKDFSWSTSLNLSYNRNTIEALSGEQYFLEEASFGYNTATHKIEVGKPIGQFYGYRTLGVYQVNDFNYDAATQTYTLKDGIPYMGNRKNVQPGYWKFEDIDGNGIINDNDRTVIGNANPDFYGGLNNTFRYKNWDLSIFFTFSYGGEVLNATKLTNTKAGRTNYNVLDVVNSSNRWMTINAHGEIVTDPEELAALNAGKTIASVNNLGLNDSFVHSWAVEDASYLRLSNVNLGYSFPRTKLKRIGVQNLRLYLTGSNLFVWTPYSGFDPEVSTKGNSLTPGVDFGAYPRSRSFIFGLNVTF